MHRKLPTYINLESYTSSDGWFGFFELLSGNRRRHAHLVASWLTEQRLDPVGMGVYTNLHTFYSDEELRREYSSSEEDLDDLLRPLRASGLLRTYRHYTEVEEPVLLDEIDPIDLRRSLVCLMDVDGVYGHLFVRVDEHDLLLYPHDDVGFGFIAESDRGKAFVERLVADLPVTEGGTVETTWKVVLSGHLTSKA